jgi:ketosteroid isomerase-like protein
MALDGPRPVAAYLAAEEAKDADALSRCFTEGGTVHDERQDYHGRDSIRQWKQEADAKYRYVLQTISVQAHGDMVTVHAGSPASFREALSNWTTFSNRPTTRLLHWRFDDDISFPCFAR